MNSNAQTMANQVENLENCLHVLIGELPNGTINNKAEIAINTMLDTIASMKQQQRSNTISNNSMCNDTYNSAIKTKDINMSNAYDNSTSNDSDNDNGSNTIGTKKSEHRNCDWSNTCGTSLMCIFGYIQPKILFGNVVRVCKSWNKIISSDVFIIAYYKHTCKQDTISDYGINEWKVFSLSVLQNICIKHEISNFNKFKNYSKQKLIEKILNHFENIPLSTVASKNNDSNDGNSECCNDENINSSNNNNLIITKHENNYKISKRGRILFMKLYLSEIFCQTKSICDNCLKKKVGNTKNYLCYQSINLKYRVCNDCHQCSEFTFISVADAFLFYNLNPSHLEKFKIKPINVKHSILTVDESSWYPAGTGRCVKYVRCSFKLCNNPSKYGLVSKYFTRDRKDSHKRLCDMSQIVKKFYFEYGFKFIHFDVMSSIYKQVFGQFGLKENDLNFMKSRFDNIFNQINMKHDKYPYLIDKYVLFKQLWFDAISPNISNNNDGKNQCHHSKWAELRGQKEMSQSELWYNAVNLVRKDVNCHYLPNKSCQQYPLDNVFA